MATQDILGCGWRQGVFGTHNHKEGIMQKREILFGVFCGVIGAVLTMVAGLFSAAGTQNEVQDVEFGKITCREIVVVDEDRTELVRIDAERERVVWNGDEIAKDEDGDTIWRTERGGQIFISDGEKGLDRESFVLIRAVDGRTRVAMIGGGDTEAGMWAGGGAAKLVVGSPHHRVDIETDEERAGFRIWDDYGSDDRDIVAFMRTYERNGKT